MKQDHPRAETAILQHQIGNRAVQEMLIQRAALMRQSGVESLEDTNKLSGAAWVSEFPTSTEVSDLDSTFGGDVQKFINALQAAGATVKINATKRPPERAYLMHWAWKITKQNYDARKVPTKKGVNINWWHGNQADSRKAAQEMVDKYAINKLKVPPSLTSRHIEGKAIDMNISWSGELKIKEIGGAERIIKSLPRDHTNSELIALGKGYSVVHFIKVEKDTVHWSTDGK